MEIAYSDEQMLTWDEYKAGEPCRVCVLPLRDEAPWEFRGLIHISVEERVRYYAEGGRYRAAHGQCRAHRWTVSGSLTTHCGRFCPPPPLSPEQIAKLRVLFAPMREGLAARGGVASAMAARRDR